MHLQDKYIIFVNLFIHITQAFMKIMITKPFQFLYNNMHNELQEIQTLLLLFSLEYLFVTNMISSPLFNFMQKI